jgi:HAE1 family hydrophobic/amphiphilic exporter-1
VFALMLIAALVVAGVVSYPSLGVNRYPSVDMPTVMVRTVYPGAASTEVESEVTQVLEDAVATVAGIDELRSISSDGSSFLLITFRLDRSIDAASQDVRDAVGGVLNRLPTGIDPPVVQKRETDSSPILTLAVSGPRSARELYLFADRFVKNVIESAPGVGQVSISGSADRAIRVNVQADRLAAYGLTIVDVREALARQNTEAPGGMVQQSSRELTLRTLGRVDAARRFSNLVIKTVNQTPIRLGDIATVVDGTKEVRTLARLNGEPAVVVSVQRQSGENTVEVIDAINERLVRSRELLPPDVSVKVIQDQSRYIEAALHEIQNHLISGSILASLTVLLFMRSWRSTLIAAVAIPSSIVATFLFMNAFGFTLNNFTMLALVLMVGVVIDDAIVVLENVFHVLEERHLSPMEAAIEGTREIALAVLATTLSLVIVFLPVSFLSSLTGRMLFEFGVTATVAIMVSMFVSFTLTPMMCSKLLSSTMPSPDGPKSRTGPYAWMEAIYLACLKVALRFRWAVGVICLLVIASNFWLYTLVRQDYIPSNVDESEFEVRLTAPEGTSLIAMDGILRRAEDMLIDMPGIEAVLATVGSRGIGGVNSGDIYVRLQDITTRTFSFERLWRGLLNLDPGAAFRNNFSQRDVMNQVRAKFRGFPELRASIRNLTSLRTGAPVDIDYTISGSDVVALSDYCFRLKDRVAKIPGIVDVDVTLHLDKPEMLARIDRERAATLGIDVREIADTLRIAVGGDDRVSRHRDQTVDDAYDVEVRLVDIDRRNAEEISQLFVRTANGDLTRLDNVVEFDYDEAAARIDRLDRQRMVALRANVADGFALSDRLTAIEREVDEMGLPAGFSTRVLGKGRELEQTLQDFLWTFVLSLIFMYIVLAAQYEHLVYPFVILLSLPLAVPFGLISLYWFGETLNLYSALGILVLFGVVKKASILQIDHTNALRAKGIDRHTAIIQANRDRLRPILMTVISFVAGMLPLLIATGPGAEERRSIAVVAVGGQTLSLVLTLLAIPVLYTIFDDLAIWFQARFASETETEAASATPSQPSLPVAGG